VSAVVTVFSEEFQI